MNRSLAINILELPNSPTDDQIKKQYRLLALRYHPDKNLKNKEKSVEQFQNIYSAYEFLLRDKTDGYVFEGARFEESLDFDDLFRHFLDTVLDDENIIFKKILMILIPKIINIIKSISASDISKIRSILEPIDRSILGKIGIFFKKYTEIFEGMDIENVTNILSNLSNSVQNTSLHKKNIEKNPDSEQYNHILLHPLLEDLFQNNVYKCTEHGEILLIPLWHHELLYDLRGSEVLVECYPILPENVMIDETNNIHIELEYGILELWFLETIEFELGRDKFSIDRTSLKMVEKQTIILEGQGISRINEMNIYSVEEKSDIYVYITIRVG